jgi:hemoglobin/transferrin/lactoferrin receptor protein
MRRSVWVLVFCLSVLASPAFADDLAGRVTDRTGGVLPGAAVRLTNVGSGDIVTVTTDREGRFRFPGLRPGTYRVSVGLAGFSDASRTLVLDGRSPSVTADFALELGTLTSEVTVAAARGARDTHVVPLRADAFVSDRIRQLTPASTGDILISAPGVTPVGSGPFQIRPRLRGLDSTRVLVLVDGERLNNARTATDRAGIEVGLVDAHTIDGIEVLGGAGSVLYGTDALSGTINIITNQARYSSARQFTMGFDGLYSSNENGRRGTVTLGLSERRVSVLFTGGVERFDDYRAGKDSAESSTSLFTNGTLVRGDTADQLGFSFGAFPDPFNAPFTRTSAVVSRSGMEGSSASLSLAAQITPAQELRIRYQRRHATNIGFPDFEPPFFFQRISLPSSDLDKISASYSVAGLASWLPRLTASAYFQDQDRLLLNQFPVQFPAPSQGFFPVNIFRLQIESATRQHVRTPGVDVQANITIRPNNLLTAGVSIFSDRSEDERTTTTQTTMIGNVSLGARGPVANVFPAPVLLGPPSVEHPVRVPKARFRDIGLFVQDEWDVSPMMRLTGGLRVDAYRVATNPTPGYSVESLVTGAVPAIDPATLPDIAGDRISRTAVTGEAGIVLWPARPVSPFGHYVRSYRHPNLEELLFSGPATTGNIVPNVGVEPETGHNVDFGVKIRTRRVAGSLAYFNNTYSNFISTEVVAEAPAGSISQAINFAKVRIQGVEAQGDAPFVLAGLLWSPSASVSWNRGTVLSGSSPLFELAGAAQDNITPWKAHAGVRVGDRGERWWAGYSMRMQTDVTRVSPLLSESPFLIAQDLLSLGGFTVHRLAAGYDWKRGNQRLGVTVAADNVTDVFYREHFQFAPARGRSISVALHVRGLR